MKPIDLASEAVHEMRKPLVRAIEAIGMSESLDNVLDIESLSQTMKTMDYIIEFVDIMTDPPIIEIADMGRALHVAVEQMRETTPTVVFQEKLSTVYLSMDGRWIRRLAELLLEQAAKARAVVFIALSTNEDQIIVSIGDEVSVEAHNQADEIQIKRPGGELSAALLICDQIVKTHGGRLWLSRPADLVNFNCSLPIKNV